MIHKLHSAGLDTQIRFHTGTASLFCTLPPAYDASQFSYSLAFLHHGVQSSVGYQVVTFHRLFRMKKNGLLGHGTPDRSSDTNKSSGTTSVDSFRQVSARPIVGRNCSMQCRPGGEQSVSCSSNEISSDSARTAAKTSRLFDAERLQPAILFTHAHAYAMLRH